MWSQTNHRCRQAFVLITIIMVMNDITAATNNTSTANTTTIANTNNRTSSRATTKVIRYPTPTHTNKCIFLRLMCQLYIPSPGPPSNHQHNNSLQSLADNFTTLHPYMLTTRSSYLTNLTMNYTTMPPSSPRFHLPQHISRLNPFHPRVPSHHRACEIYHEFCKSLKDDYNLHVAVAVFGTLSFLLNSFVIYRIISQNIRIVHQSKIYFLSMAVADLYYGFVSFIDMLLMTEVIKHTGSAKQQSQIHDWKFTSQTVSFNASLFHILVITFDRFMATTYPLFHKVHMTRKKVFAMVCCTWMLALLLGLLPLHSSISYNFTAWFSVAAGTSCCLIIVYTYVHISIIAKRRRKILQSQRCDNRSGSKSINTTFLSVSITVSFIACNSYGIIHGFFYLLGDLEPTNRIIRTDQLNLNINAVINPILYTIVEVVHNRFVVGKKAPNTANGQISNQIEHRRNLGKSAESVATLASVV